MQRAAQHDCLAPACFAPMLPRVIFLCVVLPRLANQGASAGVQGLPPCGTHCTTLLTPPVVGVHLQALGSGKKKESASSRRSSPTVCCPVLGASCGRGQGLW